MKRSMKNKGPLSGNVRSAIPGLGKWRMHVDEYWIKGEGYFMRKVVGLFVYVIASWLVLSCGGGGGVQPPPAELSVQLSANPTTIGAGGQTTLSWSSQGATSIIIDHGIGSVAVSGSTAVSPSATIVYTAVANGSSRTAQASVTVTVNVPTGSIKSLQHIIFMLQENRTFDNYFGQLNQYRGTQGLPQDVDGLPGNASNPSYDGTGIVPAYHIKTMCAENQSPSWDEEHFDANRYNAASTTATMDGFVYVAGKFSLDTGGAEIQGIRVMGYYDDTDLPYYYFMASQFATSDRWFAPVMSNSMGNRIFSLAGTTAGHTYPFKTTLTSMNIFELLENNNISWKVYLTPVLGPTDDPEDTGSTYLFSFQPFASQHMDKIVPVSQYLTDAANGTLPAVSFIETSPGLDEHPGKNVQTGAAYVATLVNTLMASPSWADSVFILSWDESGGLYDHVPPAPAVKPDNISPIDLAGHVPGDFDRTGFRLPLLVISPFTKPHYVSHNVADYTAVLKFIETRYNLPSLTNRDGAQIDMTEFFDFVNVPWKIPPTPPSQPTTGICDYGNLQ
jgi:phospholipase C